MSKGGSLMNHNLFLECEVCSNGVQLKIVAGYVNFNPFSYSCPECSITISGHLTWNSNLEEGFIKEFECNNARELKKGQKISHIIQIATEYYTDKIKEFDQSDPTLYLSPFMMDNSSHDMKRKKASLVSHTIENLPVTFHDSLKIWELYKNNNIKYLNRQLLQLKYIEPVLLGEVLKVDYEQVIPNVIYRPFIVLLNESGYTNKIGHLRKELNSLQKNNAGEIINLKNDLSNLITNSEDNLIQLLQNFIKYYNFIWPIIISTTYKTEDIDEIKMKKGILTTNFEGIKNYYVDAFEILSSILPAFLGIQNIKLRSNRNIFNDAIKSDFPTIQNIIHYDEKVINKGNKVKFFEEENIFKEYFDIGNVLNNSIRNSIGHHSYTYNPNQQLITFKDRRSPDKELYLIEFSELVYKTFFATIISIEIIQFLKNYKN